MENDPNLWIACKHNRIRSHKLTIYEICPGGRKIDIEAIIEEAWQKGYDAAVFDAQTMFGGV